MKSSVTKFLALIICYPTLWSAMVFAYDWFGPNNPIWRNDFDKFLQQITGFPVLVFFYFSWSFGFAPIATLVLEVLLFGLLRRVQLYYFLKIGAGTALWILVWFPSRGPGSGNPETELTFALMNLVSLVVSLMIVTRTDKVATTNRIDNHSQ